MSHRRLLAATAALALGAVAWVPLTSAALALTPAGKNLRGASLGQVLPASYIYWRDHGANPAVAAWLPKSAAAAGLLCLAPVGLVLCLPSARRRQLRKLGAAEVAPPPVRAASSLHGSSDWMSERDLRRLAQGGDPDHGGVVYGTVCRLDLHPALDGGRAPLLVDRCLEDATHGLVFFGSGGGKTSAVTVPCLDPDAGWRGNVLVNDPSSQAGAMCADMRREAGQRMVFLGLQRGPEERGQPPRVGLNVLGWIDPADPLFEEHVWSAVEALGREGAEAESNGANAMFKIQGKALQACLLADLLADPSVPKTAKTPAGLAERIATPEKHMRGLLETIHAESPSPLARKLAGTLMQAHPKTFSGFCVEASADLRWLMTRAYADLVSGAAPGSLSAADFTRGDTCVFLQLGVKAMQDTPQIGRAILNALLNDIYRADGRTGRRYLLLLDEIDLFGKLQTLSTAASQGRKYGVTVVGMWHGLGQMEGTWGANGARTWRMNASWEAYSAMDAQTAKDVSARCGKYTVLAPSEGTSRSDQSGGQHGSRTRGRSEGVTLAPRDLATPDEIERGLRRDEQIVFRRGEPAPIRCAKAFYFRRPEMTAKVGQDRYRVAAE